MLRINSLGGQTNLVPATTPALFTTLIEFTGARTVVSIGGYTLLTKIPGSMITGSGGKIRLVLESGGQNCTLNNVTIGPAATSGNAWNCTSVTAVTRSGLAAWSLSGAAGTLFESDEITFSVNAGTSYIVGVNQQTAAASTPYRVLTGLTAYAKSAVQEADDATRGASYTAQASRAYFIQRIDVK